MMRSYLWALMILSSSLACSDSGSTDANTVGSGEGCEGQALLCGRREIVVSRSWLVEHLRDTDVQLVDARGRSAFEAGHIPGAVALDVDALRAEVDGVGGQVAPQDVAQEVFRAAGLRNEAAIVVYGADTNTTPARLVWTLEYYGHQRVALLDGGFEAWTAQGGETSEAEVSTSPSNYTIAQVERDRRVNAQWVLDRLPIPDVFLIDARSQGEYEAGHIPGALSVDWNRNVTEGSLNEDSALLDLYPPRELGTTMVAYCQTGSRAAVTYLVLRKLGFEDVRLYDGSWAEWGSRPELPREP